MATRPKQKQPPEADLLRRLWDDLAVAGRLILDRRVSGTAKLIPVAMIAYVLSPIDLIPDFLLPFGVVDDLTAVLIGLQLFLHSAPPDVVEEYRRRFKHKHGDDAFVPDESQVIDGEYEVREHHK